MIKKKGTQNKGKKIISTIAFALMASVLFLMPITAHAEEDTITITYIWDADGIIPNDSIIVNPNPSSITRSQFDTGFTLQNPTAEGYEFLGWTTTKMVNPYGYSANPYKTELTSFSNYTLYGHWEKKDYSDILNHKPYKFNYINRGQEFTAPADGVYSIELWGSAGRAYCSPSFSDSFGAVCCYGDYVRAKLYLTKGTTMYVYCGGNSSFKTVSVEGNNQTLTFNGGGSGSGNGSSYYCYGGGATDIRLVPASDNLWYLNDHISWGSDESILSRILIAGGGTAHNHSDLGINNIYYTDNCIGACDSVFAGGGGYTGANRSYGSFSATGKSYYNIPDEYFIENEGYGLTPPFTSIYDERYIQRAKNGEDVSYAYIRKNNIYPVAEDDCGFAYVTYLGDVKCVTFDANGGTIKDVNNNSVTTVELKIPAYGAITLPANDPTRIRYDFDGWYTEKEGGVKVDENTSFDSIGDTVYAHWTPNVSYDITFYANGGIFESSGQSSITVTFEGDDVELKIGGVLKDMEKPVRAGYVLKDWYLGTYSAYLDYVRDPYYYSDTIAYVKNNYNGQVSAVWERDIVDENDYEEMINNEPLKFTYTGKPQIFTAPVDGTYSFEVWGSGGVTYTNNKGILLDDGSLCNDSDAKNGVYSGGKYAYTEVELKAGDVLYVCVGGNELLSDTVSDKYYTFNGGRKGHDGYNVTSNYRGGGATDIRLVKSSVVSWYDISPLELDNDASLLSRLITAGGGGICGKSADTIREGYHNGILGKGDYNCGGGYYGGQRDGSMYNSCGTSDVRKSLGAYTTANTYIYGKFNPNLKNRIPTTSVHLLPTDVKAYYLQNRKKDASIYTDVGEYFDNSTYFMTSNTKVGFAYITLLTGMDKEIIFDANEGTFADGSSSATKTFSKNDASFELPTPRRTGYSFDGWYTSINGGTQITEFADLPSAIPSTVYAHWTSTDKTAPLLEVMDDKPVGRLYNSSSKNITLIAIASDNVSADNELLYQFMGADGTMLADWQEDNHLILYPINGNGTYTVKVKDTAGNVATKEYILTAWDLEAPKLTVKVSPESTEEPYVQERTVTALADALVSTKTNVGTLPEKPYYVEEKTYNYQYRTLVTREMEKNFTETFRMKADRNGTYVIYARDKAGNLAHEDVVIQGVDTYPPEVDYFTQLSDDSKSVIVGIKARDVRADRYSEMSGLTTDESGAYSCFSLSDKSIELGRSELNANGWVYSAFQTTKNVNLLLTVQDKAGNSQTSEIRVNADRIREESAYNPIEDILLTNSDDSTYPACTGASVTAEIVLLDGCVESDYAYCFDYRGYVAGKKDNGTGTWASGRKKTIYANGTYHAYIKDEFGFVYEKTFEIKNIDRTKPVIQATGVNDGSIRITVTDELSGLDYIRVTGNSLEQIKEYRDLNGVLSDTEVYTSTGDGGTFHIVAYDMAGNVSSPVKVFVEGKNAVQEESIKLKVTFRNYRDVAIKNVTVDKYGKAVAPKDTQMRRSGYLFAGWDTSFERVEQNLSVRPVYVEDRTKEGFFMVVFKDSDGTVLKAENVARGSEATPPSAPEKEGKTFIGWSSTAYQNVQGNTILVAQYR